MEATTPARMLREGSTPQPAGNLENFQREDATTESKMRDPKILTQSSVKFPGGCFIAIPPQPSAPTLWPGRLLSSANLISAAMR